MYSDNYYKGGNNGLLIYLIFLGIYGYFAFGYSEEPTSVITSNSDDIIKYFPFIDGTDGESSTVDVARRYHVFFVCCFWITAFTILANFLFRLFHELGLGNSLGRLVIKLSEFSGLALLVLWILAWIWRFSPSGRYASGADQDWNDSHYGSLYHSGLFIFIMFWLMVVVLVLSLIR